MKNKKIKVPAYEFGTDEVNSLINALSSISSLYTGANNENLRNRTDVAKKSISNSISGALAGASAGSSILPGIGTAIGAGAGLLAGSIGNKGNITLTGFTLDDEYSLGTGILGAITNKDLKRRIENSKYNSNANRLAVANTQKLQSEYDLFNPYSIDTYAKGGMNTSLAYVDDGEVIQTPNKDIYTVPEQGNPTDSNLLNLPIGSKILSDTLKYPGTNKTFAQLGKEMMNNKKSKGKDKYAENAEKLNNLNNSKINDALFSVQEELKLKSGTKGKQKSIPAAANGLLTGNLSGLMTDYLYSNIPNIPRLKSVKDTENKSKDINFNSIFSNMASLIPTFSNLMSKLEQPVSTITNPYASEIKSTMRNRRFDITPALRALTENRNMSNYNVSQINPNTGANLAYRLQSGLNLDKQTSDLYSQSSNIQAQYDADYANMLNNLGTQWMQAEGTAQDINARSRAANRNIRRTGLGQLGEWAQNRELMSNQKNRDIAMLKAYTPFLQAGYTKEQVNDLLKYFN